MHSNSQPIVSASSPSSSRPGSASNPSPSKARLPNNNYSPILPSYPVLPPSHSRPPSSIDVNQSVPLAEPRQSSEPIMSNARARRVQARRSNPLEMSEQEKGQEFISNVRQNDTLIRWRRNQQSNNPLKQYQQPSSSDEQDASPIRPSNNKAPEPVIVNIYSFFCQRQSKKSAEMLSILISQFLIHRNLCLVFNR